MHFQYSSTKALMVISFTLLFITSLLILATQSTFLLVDLMILQKVLCSQLYFSLFKSYWKDYKESSQKDLLSTSLQLLKCIEL